jgi:HlyD family secretion protein
MKTLIVLIILGGLGAGGYYAYQQYLAVPEEISYTTAQVTRGAVIRTVSATGTVEPLVKVLVGSQVSGAIEKIYVDFNDEVKAGDILAEIDRDRFNAIREQRAAAVAVAQARVEEAEARLQTAQLERERIEKAFQRNVASEFELDTRKAEESASLAAVNAAKAQLQSAEADLRQADVDLEKTIIRSPIDGIVISREVDEGQTVAASLQAPELFVIGNDLRQMRVNAAVSETDIGKVRENMEAEFRVDTYRNRNFRGIVTEVRYAETVVDNVVTYTTLIDVSNPDLALRPGMTATILFEVEKVEDVLIVPNTALRFDPQAEKVETGWNRTPVGRPMQPRVFVQSGEQIREINVELGLNNGKVTEVRSTELNPGDQVVTGQQIQRMSRQNRV